MRQDYLAAYEFLRDEFDIEQRSIRQPDLYTTGDKCSNAKWPRFADKIIAALSSMFRQAVKRGKMDFNPCLGMDKAHTADPNANREWQPEEWVFARDHAPLEIKICLFLARFARLRGQTIVVVNKKQFKPHPITGLAVRYKARKNNKWVNLPVLPELQAFMAELKVEHLDGLIALRDDGTAWESEKDMQTRVSHWLRDRERDGLIGSGTTLHACTSPILHGGSPSAVPTTARWLICSATSPRPWASTTPVSTEQSITRTFGRLKQAVNTDLQNTKEQECKTFAAGRRKGYENQQGGRGGTGRRKGLKIPRWQRRVGSSPTARTSTLTFGADVAIGSPHSIEQTPAGRSTRDQRPLKRDETR